MKKDRDVPLNKAELRRRAEAEVTQTYLYQNRQLPSVTEALRLVHELQVHQMELELQNQALLEAHHQLEKTLKCYTSFYNLAPIGYATLADDGAILEINPAGAMLLHREPAQLITRRFGIFLSVDTRPTFNAFLDQVLTSVAKERCEVVLASEGTPPRRVQLEGLGITPDEDRHCHITLLDITERQQTKL